MPTVTPIRNLPYPLATDPPDVQGDLQDLAEALDTDTRNVVFADAAARDAAIPAPAQGMKCWIGDVEYAYLGGSWRVSWAPTAWWTGDNDGTSGTPAGVVNRIEFGGPTAGQSSWHAVLSPDESGGPYSRVTPDVPGLYLVTVHGSSEIPAGQTCRLLIAVDGAIRAGATLAGLSGGLEYFNASFMVGVDGSSTYFETWWIPAGGAELGDADMMIRWLAPYY